MPSMKTWWTVFGLGSLLLVGCAPDEPSPVAGSRSAILEEEGFVWSMPSRFGARDARGLLVMRTDAAYVRPASYRVDFDACPDGTSVVDDDYRWSIEGHQKRGCRVSHEFAAQGSYDVTLAIGDGESRRSVHQQIDVRDWLVAVIGDSYASGEGNPDIPILKGAPPVWSDARCHRSDVAAAVQTALALELDDPHSSVTFLSLACSGASIMDSPPFVATDFLEGLARESENSRGGGILSPYVGIEPPNGNTKGPWAPSDFLSAQLPALAGLIGSRRVDALIVSAGGNDAAFADALAACVAQGDCQDNPELQNQIASRRNSLTSRYFALAQAIDAQIAHERVFVTEYPDPSLGHRGTCSHILTEYAPALSWWVHQAESEFLRRVLLEPLNASLTSAVGALPTWRKVDGIAKAFAGHGLCSGDSFFVRPLESVALQGPDDVKKSKGAVHPNRLGQAAIRDALLDTIAQELGITRLLLSNDRLTFGPQEPNTSSVEQQLVLTKTTSDRVQISFDPPGPNFAITRDGCHGELSLLRSCTIAVAFRPTSYRPNIVETLTVHDLTHGRTIPIQLSGTMPAADLTISPSALSFPAQNRMARSEVQNLQIVNTGNVGLPIASLVLSNEAGGPALFEIDEHDCPLHPQVLAVGQGCRVAISLLSYGALGAQRAALHVTGAGSFWALAWDVPMEGTVGDPLLDLSSKLLSFGLADVGVSSDSQMLTVRNAGSAALTIHEIVLEPSADFVLASHDCPLAPRDLGVGATCSVQLVFKPSRGGTRQTSLRVVSNGATDPQWVELRGLGPSMSASPAAELDFGSVPSSSASAPRDLVLTNQSNVSVEVQASGIAGPAKSDFEVAADACTGSVLAPEASCTMTLRFLPTAVGERTAVLTVFSSAVEGRLELALRGSSHAQGLLSSNPASLELTSPVQGQSEPGTILLSNPGTQAVQITQVTSSEAALEVQRENCTARPLQPLASCRVDVVFKARDRAVSKLSLSLWFASGETMTLDVTGKGASPQLDVSSLPTSLGSVKVGALGDQRPLTLHNSGNAALRVSSIALPPGVELTSDACSGQLVAPDRSCDVHLRFHPASVGAMTGPVTVFSNVPEGSTSYTVTGTGL